MRPGYQQAVSKFLKEVVNEWKIQVCTADLLWDHHPDQDATKHSHQKKKWREHRPYRSNEFHRYLNLVRFPMFSCALGSNDNCSWYWTSFFAEYEKANSTSCKVLNIFANIFTTISFEAWMRHKFKQCAWQGTYTACGHSSLIRFCTALIFPDMFLAPSYPCPLSFWRFMPLSRSTTISLLAIASPAYVSVNGMNSSLSCNLSSPFCTNRTHTVICSFVDLSVDSSAKKLKLSAALHAFTIKVLIWSPQREINWFWISGEIY